MDIRREQLHSWLLGALDEPEIELQVVSGDASFRRYFRVFSANKQQSWIAMDAPPEKEDSHAFVAISASWFSAGLSVPRVLQHDLKLGFLLLDDFGDALLMAALEPEAPHQAKADRYYRQAMDELLKLHTLDASDLPPYDARLLQREMRLFTDWLLTQKLGIGLCQQTQTMLDALFVSLQENALQQPQVVVHRDYHSRNLMVMPDGLGMLDFQDAVKGPYTYDLVSLLRDCYIAWPEPSVAQWCEHFRQQWCRRFAVQISALEFRRHFDLMGMQRHLKAAGIFARLSIRDGKHAYLADIPRTLGYLQHIAGDYPEFADFSQWLAAELMPALASRLDAPSDSFKSAG